MVSRHSRSPIARFTLVPKTPERRGALSKLQYHPLSSPGRCRSTQIPINGDPYLIREPRATVKDRAPFVMTRYVSLSLSMICNLTQYFRHITPKKLSATQPNSSSPKPCVVNSRTAAKTSNTKPTPTSSIAICVAFDTSSVDGSHALSSSRLFLQHRLPHQRQQSRGPRHWEERKGRRCLCHRLQICRRLIEEPLTFQRRRNVAVRHCGYEHLGKGAVCPLFLGQTRIRSSNRRRTPSLSTWYFKIRPASGHCSSGTSRAPSSSRV
jgi:hypothetical protein